MSSVSPAEGNTVQQTLSDALAQPDVPNFPQGIHLRATYPSTFFSQLLGEELFGAVVLNVSHALAILEEYASLRTLLGNTVLPIITETEKDGILLSRSKSVVWNLLEQVQPAIFIPDSGMVYREDSRTTQLRGVEAYRKHLTEVTNHVRNNGWTIRILPLLKGMTQEHFSKLRPAFERFKFDNAAFSAVQYTGGEVGNAINDLVDHLNEGITVLDPENVLVLGRHGVQHLSQLPPRVTAAAGLRQFACDFRGEPFTRSEVKRWQAEREQVLLQNTRAATSQSMLDGGVR